MRGKSIAKVVGLGLVFICSIGFICYIQGAKTAKAATFNSNNLISDGNFINVTKMDTAAVQRFLDGKDSCLKNFSENGRSAAQIIRDASRGIGDASGSMNGISINTSTGTINPEAILVTLQKEQSLVTSSTCSDTTLRKAMGYGCPDSGGCSATYSGFTKQVENAAWQFRYNYERAEGHGFSDYQVGQDFSFEDWNGTHTGRFDNKATASLYRYTPHVYNGNYNFFNFMDSWFSVAEYAHTIVTQNTYPSLVNGASYNFRVTVKNTGTATWTQGRVNLATSRDRDRISRFTREGDGPSGWTTPNRIKFEESSVAPGANATFSFWMKNSNVSPGTYREYFQVVADGIGWMEDYGVYWDVRVPQPTPAYTHTFVTQNAYPTLANGQAYNFRVTVKNTGTATWTRGHVNLGTSHDRDRIPNFIRESADGSASGWTSPNRVRFQEDSVAPGANATFSFYMKNGSTPPGTHRQYFQLVADNGEGWMEDYGIYWDVNVPQPTPAYAHAFVSQNGYPTIAHGQAYKFQVNIRNTGTATWTRDQVNLGTSHDKDRIPNFVRESADGSASGWISGNRVRFEQASVAPGQNATFSFYMKNDSTPSGTHRQYFQLVADNGGGWMDDYGIYWDVRVP